ncbi:hypothetical protein OG909_09080 [Streptomyces sp. NBC_01754]|uniref:hypothetical protein n=1 Tax=Streptomyces sp. NBC_01754 TaxID=2975930 RepID=UPI002DD8ECC0|nr:hypothetical protein [Streptomyces sp. NBC_01754]WSC92431.1 hypothetical protein OG909_09080 [Streptomyces sp. NBC_01754]
MAWDEWEQFKADLAARGGPAAHMQLNSAASQDGGYGPVAPVTSAVTGGLKLTKATWVKVGAGIGDQRDGLGKGLSRLNDGQKGLGESEGCLTAAAQVKVHTSWARYAHDLSEKCGALHKILDQTGHDLLLTDEAVKAAFGQVDRKYEDTPAVGGDSGSR